MALRNITIRGDEILAKKCKPVKEITPRIVQACADMVETMIEADGVGIETINVQTLAIEVWRVPDRNLVRKSISAPDPTGEGDWAGDYGEDSVGDDGRQVWKGKVQVAGGATAQKTTTVFPLGAVLKEMKPGAYVIKARDASGGRSAETDSDNNPAQARRWIVFTDMAMLAYDGSESLDVVVRSLKSAKTCRACAWPWSPPMASPWPNPRATPTAGCAS